MAFYVDPDAKDFRGKALRLSVAGRLAVALQGIETYIEVNGGGREARRVLDCLWEFTETYDLDRWHDNAVRVIAQETPDATLNGMLDFAARIAMEHLYVDAVKLGEKRTVEALRRLLVALRDAGVYLADLRDMLRFSPARSLGMLLFDWKWLYWGRRFTRERVADRIPYVRLRGTITMNRE